MDNNAGFLDSGAIVNEFMLFWTAAHCLERDTPPVVVETIVGETPIARRPHRAAPTRYEGPRVNEMITESEVLVITDDGDNRGLMQTDEAIALAKETGFDLVEVSPNASPPVCKILDFGKYKYESQKKANIARKKQKTVDVKEIKMRPNIDTHDYDVKMRAVVKFLGEGDKVKVTLRFRGREMAHQELGMELLQRVKGDIEDISKVDAEPKLEGRQMVMVVSPLK